MIPLIRRFLITMALIASMGQKVMAENNADVIVYGSSPGGYCAAIAAAREGASVILREPSDHVGGQVSLGLIGGGNDWHSADEEGRMKIWEKHKQYTLELIHFLKTDLAIPASIRDRYSKLGLCKDEFASYDHFSPALYVRESRRMKGMYVISQKDILETPEKADPIAISSFPIDSHDCQRIAMKGGGVINEGTIFPVRRANPKQGFGIVL